MDVQTLVIRLARFTVLACAASQSFAGTIDPNTPDSRYVAFGQQFPSVIRIRADIDELSPKEDDLSITDKLATKFFRQYGSLAIIRPHWALTAAHVTTGAHNHTAYKDNKAEYPLRIFVHPAFNDNVLGYNDIALCYSAKDFQLDFYTPLYTGQDEVGKDITMAGYGLRGTFRTGAVASDGKKRAGQNTIEGVSRAVLTCSASPDSRKKPLEYMISPGDSGGGMYIGNKLAGINSFLMAIDKVPDGTYGDDSAFTRVSLYVDWIESQIAQHELALQARATTGAEPVSAE